MKTPTNISNFLTGVAFFTVCIVFLYTRVETAPIHFTHYDDLWPGYVFQVMESYSPEKLAEQISTKIGFFGSDGNLRLEQLFRDYPLIFSITKVLVTPFAIASSSTYAPFQFIFSKLFYDFSSSYEFSKFSLRLPSLVYSFLSIFLIYKISNRLNINEKSLFRVSGALILTLSWMFLIYSSQGQTYASVVFGPLVLFYLLQTQRTYSEFLRKNLLYGGIVSLLVTMNYQLAFLLPAFFISLLFGSNKTLYSFNKDWWLSLVITLCTSVLIYITFLKDRLAQSTPGVNWNAGDKEQYLINLNCGENSVSCALNFFIENFSHVMQSILSFDNIDSLTSQLYSYSLTILFLLGIYYLFKTSRSSLALFAIGSVFSIALFIIFGYLSYSPTRHMMIILPIMAFVSPFGLLFLIDLINKKILRNIYFFLAIFAPLVFYSSSFQEQLDKRVDPLQEIEFSKLIEKYSPGHIVAYNFTLASEFFPIIKNNYDSKYYGASDEDFIHYQKKSNSNKIFILCLNYESCSSRKDEVIKIIHKKFFKDLKLTEVEKIIIDKNTTNCFGDLAGSGTNKLFFWIYEFN